MIFRKKTKNAVFIVEKAHNENGNGILQDIVIEKDSIIINGLVVTPSTKGSNIIIKIESGAVVKSVVSNQPMNIVGTIHGNVHVKQNLNCDSIEGDVDVGNNINCENVYGNVKAGNNVNCNDISGDVYAKKVNT